MEQLDNLLNEGVFKTYPNKPHVLRVVRMLLHLFVFGRMWRSGQVHFGKAEIYEVKMGKFLRAKCVGHVGFGSLVSYLR
jgi:hypothetical protein